MSITLSFHGGAGTVTGSRHLLKADGSSVLIDCGLFQGLKELRLMNWEKPSFDIDAVDHLLLTHAHIDHAGYLPRLVKLGYGGLVHCTPATRDLAGILLLDSAKIQEEDARYANKKKFSKHAPALPLYDTDDAQAALGRLRPVHYDHWLKLDSHLRARFINAGHILGSAHIEVRARSGKDEITVLFSGDIGRYDMPLHPDPSPPPASDFLVIESTYGDRDHEPTSFIEQMKKPLREAIERGGTVLVPSFAVARAQLVTLLLREAMENGDIPTVPIHIDSPMAINTTRLYGKYLNEENLDAEIVGEGKNRLFPEDVQFHRTVSESRELNEKSGPRIIISSSGMLTGGRVLHHLKRLLPDERNLIVLVGFQAAGTRGRALLEGARHLKMHGEMIPVEAQFMSVQGLSAHADRHGLIRWLRSAESLPKTVFVVHGEPEASQAMAALIEKELSIRAIVPRLGSRYDLLALQREP
jgi:metallo-beta-lactamase family protein